MSASSAAVKLLPVKSSFTINEQFVILINILISIVDPPKDVHVDSTLFSSMNADQKNRILDMIAGLFLPSKGKALANKHDLYTFLDTLFSDSKGKQIIISHTFRPIKDQKDLIKDYIISKGIDLKKLELESIPVLRLKHSSAHDPRLSGLYVSFDNAYKDVVSDPIFIITGGTLVDPSTRQTSGKNVKYVIKHSSNDASDDDHLYDVLPLEYIRQLGMNTCINGDVTVKYQGNNKGWIVTVPVTFGVPIVGVFSDTCVPQTSEFEGNATKNMELAKIIKKVNYNENDTKTGMRYILIKEIGDTFQVIWLKHIFEQEAAMAAEAAAGSTPFTVRYDASNTVITSSDYVVLYRSIVNGIPVIHSTQDGTSKYYLPLEFSPETKKKIMRDGIEKIALEIISHNKQVADIIAKVAEEGQEIVKKSVGKSDTTTLWINGVGWKNSQIKNCILMLNAISLQIMVVNNFLYRWAKEQKDSVKVDTTIKDIQEQISEFHSKNIFIKKNKELYYRTINSVTVLLPAVAKISSDPVTCAAAKISPHHFNPLKGLRGGTRESQEEIFKYAREQSKLEAASASASASSNEAVLNQVSLQEAASASASAASNEAVLNQVSLQEAASASASASASEQREYRFANSYAFTTESIEHKVNVKTNMEDSYNIILGDYEAPDEWRINVDNNHIERITDPRRQHHIDNLPLKNADEENADEENADEENAYEENEDEENEDEENEDEENEDEENEDKSRSPGLLNPKYKSPFLYFYVRAYHPEIFTYANCMDIGIQYGQRRQKIKDYEALLEKSGLNKDHYKLSGDGPFLYYIRTEKDSDDEKEAFNDKKETKIYGTHGNRTDVSYDITVKENRLRIDTVRAIKYTRYLIATYPHLATRSLKSFLNQFSFIPFSHVFKGHLSPKRKSVLLGEESAAQLERPQQGGGELTDEEIEERLPAALQIAMDVYEIVYSLKIKANYLHIDYRDLIEDRLENIIRYNGLIEELQYDTSTDKELIKMLEYERAVFYYDLENLPGGPELLQKYTNQLTSESHTESTNEFNSQYGNVPEYMKQGIEVGSSGGRFRKTRRNRKVKKLKKAYTKSRRALKKQSRKNK